MTITPGILLTGGTGLIGSGLIKMLQSGFGKVNVTYRSRTLPLDGVNWIKLDLLTDSATMLDPILKNTDIIIHNAASVKLGRTRDEIDEIKKVNIQFTKKLLERAAKNNIKKIIFTSSLSVIKKPVPTIILEDSATEPLSYYSESKFICENMIAEYAEKYNVKYCIMRVSSPVAGDLQQMPETVVKKWIQTSLAGKPIEVHGSGSRTQDFVSVADISLAFLLSIKNLQASGIFNIASGTSVSMLTLAGLITEKFGNDYLFTGTDANEQDRWNVSIDKAREQLGFQPSYTASGAIIKLLDTIRK